MTAVGVKLTAGAVPVPLRATVCGEPDASSVIAIVPVNAPATVGAKAAVNVQLAAAARVAPQVFDPMVKEDALVPQAAIEPMANVAVPVLLEQGEAHEARASLRRAVYLHPELVLAPCQWAKTA